MIPTYDQQHEAVRVQNVIYHYSTIIYDLVRLTADRQAKVTDLISQLKREQREEWERYVDELTESED